MKAVLKHLHAVDFDLATFYPEDPTCFSFSLRAMIGPEGEEGSVSFDFLVVTPNWLIANRKEDEIVFGRHR